MKCKEMISMKFEELMKELKEREKKMIVEIEEIKEQKKKEIYIQKDEMEMMLHGIKTTSQITQILIENGTQIEIGKSQKQLMARLDTLNSFPYSFEPIHDSYFNFNSIKIDDLIQNINHFGEMVTKDPGISSIPTLSVPVVIGGRRDYSKIAENQQPLIQFGSKGNEDGQFDFPRCVAINSQGEIIVCDRANHRIQIFNRDGEFVRKFGTEVKENVQFNQPFGVSVDQRNDQIIVSDTHNHRIQIFDAEGQFIKKFGSMGNRDGQIEYPVAAIVDSNGNYFITDFGNHGIQVFDSTGQFIRKFGTEGDGNGQLNNPIGIGLLSNGNVVVSDCGNKRISIFDSLGNFIKIIAAGEINKPFQLFIDSNDNILVADYEKERIAIYSLQSGNLINSNEGFCWQTSWNHNGSRWQNHCLWIK